MRNKKYLALLAIAGILVLPRLGYLSSITEDRIIELTNKERLKYDIPVLKKDTKLTEAALAKGKHILDKQLFQHNFDDRKFSAWIKESGYVYRIAGENLAIDFLTSEGAMKAWMASPSHKENIINPEYRDIGVAVLEGSYEGHDAIIIVQIFGTMQDAPAIAKIEEKVLTGTTPQASPSSSVLSSNPVAGSGGRTKAVADILLQSLALAVPLTVIYLSVKGLKLKKRTNHTRLAYSKAKITKS